jgi:hypothetical protein
MGPERSIAKVMCDGDWVGQAFAVDERHLVTCAHVVNRALGRMLEDSSKPGDRTLTLEFPYAGRPGDLVVRTATVEKWLPADAKTFRHTDAALLRLGESLRIRPVELASSSDSRERNEVGMFGPVDRHPQGGFVEGHPMGRVGPGGTWLQVHIPTNAVLRPQPGFSGGPVWLLSTGQIVGMLARVDDAGTVVELLTKRTIKKVLPPPREVAKPLAAKPKPEPSPPPPPLPERSGWRRVLGLAAVLGVVDVVAVSAKVGFGRWAVGSGGVAAGVVVVTAGLAGWFTGRKEG